MNFPDTCWTLLAQASLNGGANEQSALADFCKAYWRPVRECIRARGVLADRVEDLTQEFFLHVMQRGMLRRAEPQQGRFRSYLMGALRYFLADDATRNAAIRRGGQAEHCEVQESSASYELEEAIFDRDWAQNLLDRALVTVETEMKSRRDPAVWELLRRYLPGGSPPTTYDELMAVMGVGDGGAKAEISRLRARYREALRREVGRTVSSPDQIDDELAHLRHVLSAANLN